MKLTRDQWECAFLARCWEPTVRESEPVTLALLGDAGLLVALARDLALTRTESARCHRRFVLGWRR